MRHCHRSSKINIFINLLQYSETDFAIQTLKLHAFLCVLQENVEDVKRRIWLVRFASMPEKKKKKKILQEEN